MKKISPYLLGLSLAVACSCAAVAQDQPTGNTVPKVLQIQREFLKPGKTGAVHDKSESAFVQAMTRAKWPTHYWALNSMSGKSRALYLTGYESFEAWEKDAKAVEKNATLSADLDRAMLADGELQDGFDQVIYTFDEDLSYKTPQDIPHARFVDLTVYKVRPGHVKEWREVVKQAIDVTRTAGLSGHWAMFEVAYGADNDTFVAISADKSLSEIDTGMKEDKQFRDAFGEEGWKAFNEKFASAVESSHSELFSINPKQSYVSDSWIAADRDFWKPKAAAPASKPAAAEKKAGN
jgi:hypothetical protein